MSTGRPKKVLDSAAVKTAYEQLHNVQKVAAQFGTSSEVIRRHLHAIGMQPKQIHFRKATEAEKNRWIEIKNLFDGGVSTTAIAKRYGVTRQRIAQILKKVEG